MPGADRLALLGSMLPDTFAADCRPLPPAAVVLERTPLHSGEKSFVDTT